MIAGLYVRVSTDDQVEFGVSIDAQKRRLREYCINHNIEIYKIYADEGISGAKYEERLALQEMLSDARQHNIDTVLCVKTDRLSRDLLILLTIKKELDDTNTELVITDEPINLKDESGVAMFSIMGVWSQLERKKISERMMSGKRELALQGIKRRNGNAMPFGYYYDEATKRFEPIPDKIGIVKSVFNMYNNGASFTAIAKYFKPIITEKRINETFAPRIIYNPVYKGFVAISYYDKVIAQNKKPKNPPIVVKATNVTPIVDEDTWDKANARARYTFNTKKKCNDDYYLKDVMYCDNCKYHVRTLQSRSSKGNLYYYCCQTSNREIHVVNKCASSWYVNRDVLHAQFEDLIKNIKPTMSANDKLILAQYDELKAQMLSVSSSIEKKQLQKNTLLEKLSLNVITDDEYLQMSNLLTKDINNLNNTLNELNTKYATLNDIKEYQTKLVENMRKFKSIIKTWNNLPSKQKRLIVDEFIERIYVWDKKITRIEFKL